MPAMPEDLEYKLAKVITEKVGMYRKLPIIFYVPIGN